MQYMIELLRYNFWDTSVECLSAIALRSPSALANQTCQWSSSANHALSFPWTNLLPRVVCLYTRWEINTRSQNSFWDWSKMHCSSVGRKQWNISVSYICVDFYEIFPSDGWMPSRSRPERIVRSNIRLRKKATRIVVFWDFQHCRFGYV